MQSLQDFGAKLPERFIRPTPSRTYVLRHARHADRRDVRIFNGAGEALPMAWAGPPPAAPVVDPRQVGLPRFGWPSDTPAVERDNAVTVEMRDDGTVVRLQRRGTEPRHPALDGAAAMWLLDLSGLAAGETQALVLHWQPAAAGVVRQVVAQASSDVRNWRQVAKGTVLELHDATTGQSAVQRRLVLRPLQGGERYLRLRFDAPLVLQSAQAELAVAAAAHPLEAERFRLTRVTPHNWTLDAGAVLPVQRLQVHVPQDNGVLPLAIARRLPETATGRGGDWAPVANHTAYRLVRDRASVDSPPLELGGVAARHWRFMLDERVAPTDRGPDVTLWWPAVQLIFAARGPGPFLLAVGQERAPALAIDRSVLMPGYRPGAEFELPSARLGDLALHPAVAPSLAESLRQAGPEQRRRWLLWATLAVAVVVLALLAWRLARDLRTGRSPPPGD